MAKERTAVDRARRIEIYVYVGAAVSFVLLGTVLTSKLMNWIVGPAYFVAVVTVVTPVVLKLLGVADPDAGSYARWRAVDDAARAAARPDGPDTDETGAP